MNFVFDHLAKLLITIYLPPSKNDSVGFLTLFSWALCDDHTPRAMSPAAFCHNMANFVQNSNFDFARARVEGSSAPAMSKFEFWKKIAKLWQSAFS